MSKTGFIELNVKRKSVRIHLCGDTFTFKRIRPLLDDADDYLTAQATVLNSVGRDEYKVIFDRDADTCEYPINDAATAVTGHYRLRNVRGGAIIAKELAPGIFAGIDLNTCHKIKKLFDLREEIVNSEKT